MQAGACFLSNDSDVYMYASLSHSFISDSPQQTYQKGTHHLHQKALSRYDFGQLCPRKALSGSPILGSFIGSLVYFPVSLKMYYIFCDRPFQLLQLCCYVCSVIIKLCECARLSGFFLSIIDILGLKRSCISVSVTVNPFT